MHVPALSKISNKVIERLVHFRGHLLEIFGDSIMGLLDETYARTIHDCGAPLDSFVEIIDCTHINLCRPGGLGILQSAAYLGTEESRSHFLVYQALNTLDGFLIYTYGPELGRCHEMTLSKESWLGELLQVVLAINGTMLYICCHEAYFLRPWLQNAFQRLSVIGNGRGCCRTQR